ncbi:MAG: SusC/RagA family TonB-linked outer membrane protein [Chitinophagaceae bacterium]
MRKLACLLVGIICLSATSWAQSVTLRGKVTDAKTGTPLEGVSVTTFDGKVGVKTNTDGSYSISFPTSSKTLNFSYAGYAPELRAVGKLLTMDVELKSDEVNLKEVVVTAFGIKKDKKTLGYGVSQLNAEELTQAHTTNVTNALAGKVAGVRVSGAGGSFTGSSIIIRGNTTFTGSNQPLFVIDGVPFDNGGGGQALQTGTPSSNRGIDINQDEIESMSILKGPSAAALYGSRASNGVILITTKKGRGKAKNNVNFTSSYSQDRVNRLPDYQNSYAQGSLGIYNPTGTQQSWGPAITGQTVTNAFGKSEILKAYPDNVRDIFTTGENLQNSVSFAGGSDRTNFRLSYGNNVSTGIIDNNRLVRNNFTVNAGSKITEKLSVSISANYVNNVSRRTQQGNQLSNPLFRAYFTPRTYDLTGIPFENADGSQNFYNNNVEDNAYWTIKNNRYRDEINRIYGYAALNYKFSPSFQFDYKIGTDAYNTFVHAYDQITARGQGNTVAGGLGGIVERRNTFRSVNSNGFFTFNKKFGDFTTTAIVGNEISQIYSTAATIIGRGVIIRDFEQIKNTTAFFPTNGSSQVRLIGIYGDFTVGYKSIASLNVTLRNDFSSTFKSDKNSYLYNAVAGSLNITELVPQLKGDVIENIKLRGNVSTVGKAGTDFVYATDSYFTGASSSDGFGPNIAFPFGGLQGFTLQDGAGNALLGPEFTTNKEIAAEVSLFRGRLSFEGTVYQQNSKDLIFGVPVSNTSGIGSVVKNAGKLSNKGVELSVTAIPLKTKLGSWTINVNYTQFKSKVDALDNGVANIFLGGFTTPNIRLVVGDEYGQIYGNAYQRDAKTGAMLIGANGLPLATPGVQKIGNPNPKYLLGVTNTIQLKDFTLSFLLDIKKGGDQYSRNIADIRRNGVAAETAQLPRLDANNVPLTPYIFPGVYASNGQPNTTAVTAQNYWGNSGKYVAAEGFIVETSWFRVREASLSYKLPGRILSKTLFGNAELSLFGRNLFLRAPNYPHLDPEQNALGVSNAQGLEFNSLPQTRSFGVSLKLSL